MLGLQEQWRAPDGATAYSTGSGPIIILSDKNADESKAQFNFETSDISQAYRSMKSSGIVVSDIRIVADTSMFFFEDLLYSSSVGNAPWSTEQRSNSGKQVQIGFNILKESDQL